MSDFYDEGYYKTKIVHGMIQGEANLFKFKDYIRPRDKVLDFGCGGGFLLAAVQANDKIGIEINDYAAEEARKLGIKVFSTTLEVASDWADCIISNHALEHVEDPSGTMKEFFRILRPGGSLVVVTPYDSVSIKYSENDPDRHLFGWSPSNLGNLARAAGFNVIDAAEICHRWPPKWELIWKYLGSTAFHFASRVFGILRRSRTQVRLIAQKAN